MIEDGWRQQAVDVDDKLEGRRLLPAGQQDSSQEAGEEHGQTFHTDFSRVAVACSRSTRWMVARETR